MRWFLLLSNTVESCSLMSQDFWLSWGQCQILQNCAVKLSGVLIVTLVTAFYCDILFDRPETVALQ